MNAIESKKDICRICLEESVVLDWNTTLLQYHDMTYKDCYYKYTQLEYPGTDPFPQMLCHNCCNALIATHTLILKALKSQQFFKEKYSLQQKFEIYNLTINTSTDHNRLGDIKCAPTEFETVLARKIEIIDDYFGEDVPSKPVEQVKESVIVEKIEIIDVYDSDEEVPTKPVKQGKESALVGKPKTIAIAADDIKSITTEECNYTETDSNDDIKNVEPKMKKKYKEKKKLRMYCSICSKILHNKYALQMHEKTHFANRERKETCTVCGVKFFDKRNLYAHMRTHKENREKHYKCEFCSKAFYDNYCLNRHRRIHLGPMSSHSATTINTDTKKRSKYYVRCKHCDKSIRSTTFKAHTAAHLNEPLAKCTICSKEFFSRHSCVEHVKKIHKKTNGEFNDFIVVYKKNRISHLFLKQKADIQNDNE